MNASPACPLLPGLLRSHGRRLLCHPHDTLVDPLVSSRTAGAGSRGLEPLRILLGRRERLPRHRRSCSETHVPKPAYLFKKSSVQAVGVFPLEHPLPEPSDQAHEKVLSAAGNGSSRPFDLFKKTDVQGPRLPPPTTAFPGLRIMPVTVACVTGDGSSRTATTAPGTLIATR